MTSVRYDSLSSLSACRSSERYLFDDNFCLVNLPGLSSLGRHVAHLDIYLAVRTPKSKQAVASKKKRSKRPPDEVVQVANVENMLFILILSYLLFR